MGDGLVNLEGLAGGFFPGELGGAVEAAAAGFWTVDVVFEGGGQGGGDFVNVVGIKQAAGAADHFGDSGGIGANHGSAAGQSFQRGQTKSFI